MRLFLASLLLFGSMAAFGDTVRISSYGSNSSYITSGAASSSVTATSIITLDNLQKIASTTDTFKDTSLLGIKIASNSDYSISVGSYTVDDVLTSQLRMYNNPAGETIDGPGTQFTWYDDHGDALTTQYLNSIDLGGAVKGAITLGYNAPTVSGVTDTNKGTAVLFSVLYEDGHISNYYGINTNQKWDSGHVASITYDDDVLQAPDIKVWTSGTPWTQSALVATHQAILILEPSSPMVPEPTTATLSLLALAGLAARRRRK